MTTNLSETPLYAARAAIDAAEQEIEEAYEAWAEESDAVSFSSLEIVRDSESLSMCLVVEYETAFAESVHVIAERLGPVLKKHGIARVQVVFPSCESAGVGYDDDQVGAAPRG